MISFFYIFEELKKKYEEEIYTIYDIQYVYIYIYIYCHLIIIQFPKTLMNMMSNEICLFAFIYVFNIQ